MPDDREAAVRAIALGAKAARKPVPRSLWVATLILGGACAIAAAIVFFRDPPAKRSADLGPKQTSQPSSDRFGMGIGIGLGAGIVIGLSVGRARARRR